MRRKMAVLIPGAMVLALGCSAAYENRIQLTLAKMEKERKLDKNLQPPPGDGPLKDKDIYVRAPKPLEAAKEPSLGSVQPGVFDAAESFFDKSNSFLHVLARMKTPKKAPAKGATPEPAVARQPFNADAFAQIRSVFGEDEGIAPEKLRDFSEGGVKFKRLNFAANGKSVDVYIYKDDTYDVALVFVFDPAEKATMGTKINLCLESFAVGRRAKARYSKGTGEEVDENAGAGVPL